MTRSATSAARTPAILGGRRAISEGDHRQWPELLETDRAAVLAVLDRGVLWGVDAPEVSSLEREFADYVGAAHCIALNSGTAALHCCAAAVGLGPGDEVVVPAFSFVASALAMVHQGATPVFCDIEPETYNIDRRLIPERVTARTKAVVVVHVHGLPADMDAILPLARSLELAVIEDAAQAPGARYRGRTTGTFGACAGFSLNATKNLCGGEGGLFVTSDDDAHDVARRLSVFGEDHRARTTDDDRLYRSHGVGWNYRYHELSAALARVQLARLDAYNARARANARILTEGLSRIAGFIPPVEPTGRESVFHKYRVRLDPDALGFDGPATVLRDTLLRALRAEGVEAVLWQTRPLPEHPVFRKRPYAAWQAAGDAAPLAPWDPDEFPEASRLLDSSLVLGSEERPLYVQEPALMERYVDAVEKVVESLERVLSRGLVTT